MKARAQSHLIGRRDLNPGWLLLYAATFALAALCAWVRVLFVALVLLILNWLAGLIFGTEASEATLNWLALLIGFAPLAISLATLVYPFGGWWFQQQQGGRRPSERERALFESAFAELQRSDQELRAPRHWFVVEDSEADACTYADALMVTRGMLEGRSFPAVLAHELGHLNSSDARVSAAVYRMTTPPREPVGFPFRLISFLASGRAAMALMRTPWAIYWRAREKAADAYAAALGQAEPLAAYLDTHALEGDLPTPFKAFGDSSHPWTEHRIEDLEAEEFDE